MELLKSLSFVTECFFRTYCDLTAAVHLSHHILNIREKSLEAEHLEYVWSKRKREQAKEIFPSKKTKKLQRKVMQFRTT